MSKKVVVMGSFDNLRSRDVRFLEQASKIGELQVLLLSDQTIRNLEGREPNCPQEERRLSGPSDPLRGAGCSRRQEFQSRHTATGG